MCRQIHTQRHDRSDQQQRTTPTGHYCVATRWHRIRADERIGGSNQKAGDASLTAMIRAHFIVKYNLPKQIHFRPILMAVILFEIKKITNRSALRWKVGSI